ncbi:MAG: zinc ribbon domain-containing protein [bacterium]
MDRTLPLCPVCQTPTPASAAACPSCGVALDAPGGHRTLVGLPGIASPGPEATLLGLPPPRLVPGPPPPVVLMPAVADDAAEETLLGPPQPAGLPLDDLDGATLLDSFAPMPVVARAPSSTPAPALAAEQDAIVLDEPPDAPLPALRTTGAALRTADLDASRLVATRRMPAAGPGRWRQAGLFVGVAVVAGLAAAVAIMLLRDDFRAELAGDLSVTRTSSGYLVQVGVRTSGPARVTWPGGRSAVDGEATLRFELERAATHLGDNTIALEVSPGSGRPRTLTVHVLVHYEWLGILQEGGADGLVAGLKVQPGWAVELAAPGRVEARAGGEVRLYLPRPGPPAVRFKLRSPAGEVLTFDEPLRRSSP